MFRVKLCDCGNEPPHAKVWNLATDQPSNPFRSERVGKIVIGILVFSGMLEDEAAALKELADLNLPPDQENEATAFLLDTLLRHDGELVKRAIAFLENRGLLSKEEVSFLVQAQAMSMVDRILLEQETVH